MAHTSYGWLVVSIYLKNIGQNGIISPGRDENKKCLKPPPRWVFFSILQSVMKRFPVISCSFLSRQGRNSTLSHVTNTTREIHQSSGRSGLEVQTSVAEKPTLDVGLSTTFDAHNMVSVSEILRSPVEGGSLPHYLQGFIHTRWCRTSSINSVLQKAFKITYC